MQIRKLLTIVALAWSGATLAQGYPNKPITMIVAAPPGGATDVVARVMAETMGKSLGQTIVVENKPGASGMLATQNVARAPADGYTLLFTTTTPVYYAPHMFSKMAYDVRRDLAFITHVCDASLVLAVNKDVPAKNLSEFVAWATANKGKVNYGSWGVGSSGHLLSSYLSESRKLEMHHVPYKGETPLLQDMIGGQLPLSFATVGSMLPHIKTGALRPLAVLGDERLPDLPDVPTLKQQGYTDPEFKLIGGLVMMAPAGTPAPILARIEKEARAAVQSTPIKARLNIYGLFPVGNSAEDARRSFEASNDVIARLVKISGAKLD